MEFLIPDKVQVGGVDYDIRMVRGLAAQEHLRGECQYYVRLIRLDPELTPLELQAAFVHEICHAIDDAYALDLSEDHVKALAHGLMQVIRQLQAAGKGTRG